LRLNSEIRGRSKPVITTAIRSSCNPVTAWPSINEVNTEKIGTKLVHKESGEEFDYHPSKGVRLEVDEIMMLTYGIKTGLGIGYVPDYFALSMIAQGEMNHVLPDWSSKVRTLYMLYRDRDLLPMRVRLFIEFVIMHFE